MELLVVMGIIALLVGLMVPAVISLTKSNNLNSGGRLVSNVLTAARSEAINQRRLVQFRVATRWTHSSGGEDLASSYRRFSVWRKPLPSDPVQSTDPSDPYVQVSSWETLPTGIVFERDVSSYSNLPATGSPNDPGTFFLAPALGNTRTGILVPAGTADIAWIEFTPTGASIFSGNAPGKVYVLVTEGVWDGATIHPTQAQHSNWLVATVEPLVGRIAIIRP